ncbi:MAG: glycosyl transferase [Eubacterium sp.]|nr:glycosyl transferase [Eubacterium sp.]
MKFGYFDDEKREYVVTSPKTPLPWINYLGSDGFFRLISNTGGGYAFYRDASLMRLTRYRYNDDHPDSNGHYIYIKDGNTVWNPGWQPVQTELDSYSCRHGMGYTVLEGVKNGVSARQEVFVPLGDMCEVTRLTLTNGSDSLKDLDIFSYLEFCFWNAQDDMSNFQRNFSIGEVEVCGSDIYHKTEYRERRNHYAVFSVNKALTGFDTDRSAFLGAWNGPDRPEAVLEGKSRDSIAHGWAVIGSHHLKCVLEPGASESFIFVLAYCENPLEEKFEQDLDVFGADSDRLYNNTDSTSSDRAVLQSVAGAPLINKAPAERILSKYRTDEQLDDALADLKEYWDRLLSVFSVESCDEKLDRTADIWNQYQCMATFNMSRSASYYESGLGRGMGFRDSCQDIFGFVHMIPEKARERIIDIANTQFEDGSAYHQYQPLTKRGNMGVGSGFNDDPLWLIAATTAYIRETGDYSILHEQCDFDNDIEKRAPLLEHLNRSFRFTATHKGPHGLPLIGRADWNDCLNLNCFSMEPGESFQTTGPSEGSVAESVFIGGMFVKYGREYEDLLRHLALYDQEEDAGKAALYDRASREEIADMNALADEVESEVREVEEAVLTAGWDGEWFRRAYDAASEPVGSSLCEEGKIYIEPQGMSVMAGIGLDNGYAAKALESVQKHLECEYGIVILDPPYSRYHAELGEISSYPPGYKENAGVFCHNNPWIVIAETMLGHGDRAMELLKKIDPVYLEDKSEIHKTEPYVYCQMVSGKEAAVGGEGKNSWLTGSASWAFTAVSQHILGVKPELDGLRIDPCIPSGWKGFKVMRRFRGAVYKINVTNASGRGCGVTSIRINGVPLSGDLIPPQPDGASVEVDVTIG